MKKYNIVLSKEYQTKDKETKTYFAPVGEITIFPQGTKPDGTVKIESGILKLNFLKDEFVVFPWTPREERTDGKSKNIPPDNIHYPDDNGYGDIVDSLKNDSLPPPDWETQK